jgi:RNA polymerase sigma-70 factor (ECF subfamily)
MAAVYQMHGAAAHRLARHILQDKDLAADAVQEAFLSLWLLGDSYVTERRDLAGLLRTLVHHRAVDLLRNRRSGVSTVPLDDAATVGALDPDDGPEDQAFAADQKDRVAGAIRTLSPAKREVLVLAYVKGLSHVRIADLLGMPLGTVKTRIRGAKRDLREVFLNSPSHPSIPRARHRASSAKPSTLTTTQ